ncbi:MAG: hypothetical protein HC906_17395 [Bacteroidales bacterium]|nr:hypothetical protein [Bacteroidales bacterium]
MITIAVMTIPNTRNGKDNKVNDKYRIIENTDKVNQNLNIGMECWFLREIKSRILSVE